MPFWLESWAGDNAGDVIGRQHNELLITMTTESSYFPLGLVQGTEIGGVMVYPNCSVNCLTPGVGNIYAVNVKSLAGNVFSIGIAQLGTGDPEPLDPGVHLFSVGLYGGGSQSATIATAIVDGDMPFIKVDPPDFSGFMPLALLRESGFPPQAPG